MDGFLTIFFLDRRVTTTTPPPKRNNKNVGQNVIETDNLCLLKCKCNMDSCPNLLPGVLAVGGNHSPFTRYRNGKHDLQRHLEELMFKIK